MLEVLQAGIPLGIALSFMIGPVFFVLLETGATKGFRAALMLDLGVILADVFFILIAYFASYQLIQNISNQPGLYVAGGMILLGYGLISIFKKLPKKTKKRKIQGTYLSLLFKGFFLNVINVGVLIFWFAVWLWAGATYNNDSKKIGWFFTAVILSYFLVDMVKVLLAKQLKRKLTADRIQILKKVLGIILVICGVVLVTKGFLPSSEFDINQKFDNLP